MELDTEDGVIKPEDFEIINGETVFKGEYLAHLESRCEPGCSYCKNVSLGKLEK